jgi:hypothetical protein
MPTPPFRACFLKLDHEHFARRGAPRRYDFSIPRPDEVTVGGYSNSNAVVAYDYTERATVYLRADNLWNSKYHEYIGFPAPGISVRLGGRNLCPVTHRSREEYREMAAIKVFQFGFFGSFQCRLATDPDPTGSARQSTGWTYDLGEVPFDRVIRLSAPVRLRSGLYGRPWSDTKVIGIQTDTGAGLKPVSPSDPFMSQVVSFGKIVMFDSAAGGGASKEALINFEFSAGTMFKATAPTAPSINTTNPNVAEGPGFDAAKTAFRAALPTPSARRASYSSQGAWTAFYQLMGTVDDAALNPPTISAASGALKDVATQMASKPPASKGRWVIHIDFYHFDGDTLCGDCNGWLTGYF